MKQEYFPGSGNFLHFRCLGQCYTLIKFWWYNKVNLAALAFCATLAQTQRDVKQVEQVYLCLIEYCYWPLNHYASNMEPLEHRLSWFIQFFFFSECMFFFICKVLCTGNPFCFWEGNLWKSANFRYCFCTWFLTLSLNRLKVLYIIDVSSD